MSELPEGFGAISLTWARLRKETGLRFIPTFKRSGAAPRLPTAIFTLVQSALRELALSSAS